ncbi:amidohydrolase [Pendulispora rubella]|uniref:Amidohydrolase n=1 Tax=Pendulispora rubella TaxID=2741070 RepID=A0ABZ2L6W7_9BACT
MKRSLFRMGVVALAVGAAGLACHESDGSNVKGVEPATWILRGGAVHAMDGARTVATAIAVREEQIVAVGSDALVNTYVGANTKITELHGQMVLPGFIDAHIHSAEGSRSIGKCSLVNTANRMAEIRAAVQACIAAESPAGGVDDWFEVFGVDPSGLVMTKADLDGMLANRPMILVGVDNHTAWLNTRGLQQAGITASTPDPVGGRIQRNAQGEPTGFLNDSALFLALAAIPPATLEQRIAQEKIALKQHNALGLTSIQDALATPEVLQLYAALEGRGELTVRVRGALASKVVDVEAEYQRLAALRAQYATGHPRLRADAVKILADGVPEYPAQTAALLHPYLDGHGQPTTNFGAHYFDPEVLRRYVRRLDADGFSVHVHAIGDAMARAALDAFAYAREKNGISDHRHQIAHLQLLDPADFSRFAALGVIANMQLLWAIPTGNTLEGLQPYIDPTSYHFMYPAASLHKAGAVLAGGSDWPISTENPLLAMENGATRTNAKTGAVLNADERVSIDDMLAAYTIHAAEALKQERTTGSLEVGKLADMVVLDRDLTTLAPNQIHTAAVQMTILDGRIVYDASVAPLSPRTHWKAYDGTWRGPDVHSL